MAQLVLPDNRTGAGPHREAHAAGIQAPVIATASIVYFPGAVAHAVVYAFGVPWLRTLAFAVDLAAQAVIAWQLLTA